MHTRLPRPFLRDSDKARLYRILSARLLIGASGRRVPSGGTRGIGPDHALRRAAQGVIAAALETAKADQEENQSQIEMFTRTLEAMNGDAAYPGVGVLMKAAFGILSPFEEYVFEGADGETDISDVSAALLSLAAAMDDGQGRP